MQRVVEWLQLQQQPRPAPAPRPTRPSVPLTVSPRDPVATWAQWRLAQEPNLRRLGQETGAWDIRTQAAPEGPESAKLRASLEGGGPIRMGAPGAFAGVVRPPARRPFSAAEDRPPQWAAPQVDDQAHFDRAMQAMQAEYARLGRTLTQDEADAILRSTR
jgi:hypothetical protein